MGERPGSEDPEHDTGVAPGEAHISEHNGPGETEGGLVASMTAGGDAKEEPHATACAATDGGAGASQEKGVALSALACRFLDEPLSAVCADLRNGRLLLAGRFGISSARLETLIDGGTWLDEGVEGYFGCGDHLRNIAQMGIRQDGRFLVTSSRHEAVCIVHELDPFSGRNFSLARVLRHEHVVLSIEFQVGEDVLLVATGDGRVLSWLLEDGAEAAPPFVHDSPVVLMRTRFCEERSICVLACVCREGTCYVWSSQTQTLLGKFAPRDLAPPAELGGEPAEWRGHTGAITHCDLSASGLELATASTDRTCKARPRPPRPARAAPAPAAHPRGGGRHVQLVREEGRDVSS
jgi:hypothetical protein